MKVLHLTLKKKWFDMIDSGQKKEEYRDIKRYWADRLCSKILCDESEGWLYNIEYSFTEYKQFDAVKFTNGYAKNSPTIMFGFNGITMNTGNSEWGAEPAQKYFVIKIGNRINPLSPNK